MTDINESKEHYYKKARDMTALGDKHAKAGNHAAAAEKYKAADNALKKAQALDKDLKESYVPKAIKQKYAIAEAMLNIVGKN